MEAKLAERLRALRYECNETQQDVADMLNVKRPTYTMYEKGSVLPPYDKLKKLADYFEVSVEYLMGETNFRKPEKPKGSADVDLLNINNAVRLLLDELNDKSAPVNVDGVQLDSLARDMLKNALQNCLNIGDMIAKTNKGEQ